MDSDELRDYEDQDPPVTVPPGLTSTANLGPYARFLRDLTDYFNIIHQEYTKAIEALLCCTMLKHDWLPT
jgi:hypothetical protein